MSVAGIGALLIVFGLAFALLSTRLRLDEPSVWPELVAYIGTPVVLFLTPDGLPAAWVTTLQEGQTDGAVRRATEGVFAHAEPLYGALMRTFCDGSMVGGAGLNLRLALLIVLWSWPVFSVLSGSLRRGLAWTILLAGSRVFFRHALSETPTMWLSSILLVGLIGAILVKRGRAVGWLIALLSTLAIAGIRVEMVILPLAAVAALVAQRLGLTQQLSRLRPLGALVFAPLLSPVLVLVGLIGDRIHVSERVRNTLVIFGLIAAGAAAIAAVSAAERTASHKVAILILLGAAFLHPSARQMTKAIHGAMTRWWWVWLMALGSGLVVVPRFAAQQIHWVLRALFDGALLLPQMVEALVYGGVPVGVLGLLGWALVTWRLPAVPLAVALCLTMYSAAGHDNRFEYQRYAGHLLVPLFAIAAAEWERRSDNERRFLGAATLVTLPMMLASPWMLSGAQQRETRGLLDARQAYPACVVVAPTIDWQPGSERGDLLWQLSVGVPKMPMRRAVLDGPMQWRAPLRELLPPNTSCLLVLRGRDCNALRAGQGCASLGGEPVWSAEGPTEPYADHQEPLPDSISLKVWRQAWPPEGGP
ncbi:MAG: hypothetical protein AAFV53_15905 [Myxococcota bacterium]